MSKRENKILKNKYKQTTLERIRSSGVQLSDAEKHALVLQYRRKVNRAYQCQMECDKCRKIEWMGTHLKGPSDYCLKCLKCGFCNSLFHCHCDTQSDRACRCSSIMAVINED